MLSFMKNPSLTIDLEETEDITDEDAESNTTSEDDQQNETDVTSDKLDMTHPKLSLNVWDANATLTLKKV